MRSIKDSLYPFRVPIIVDSGITREITRYSHIESRDIHLKLTTFVVWHPEKILLVASSGERAAFQKYVDDAVAQ